MVIEISKLESGYEASKTEITFGLTGGIASGKSTVTRTFRNHNIPMVDADIIAREVVAPGTLGLELLIKEFGEFYRLQDGNLDRTKLGKLIFSDSTALERINEIMAPLINAESSLQIQRLHEQGHRVVGYDAALIIEMGNSEKFRPLIVVHCSKIMQIERLIKRNNLTRDEALARIEAQMPVENKKLLADYLIDTSGTIDESIRQTEDIIKKILGKENE